jgi:hypothetical protein
MPMGIVAAADADGAWPVFTTNTAGGVDAAIVPHDRAAMDGM